MSQRGLSTSALWYARHGWPVLPVWGVDGGRCACGQAGCERVGKHPIGALAPNGFKDASTEIETVTAWWTQYPTANIGIATGARAGIWILDVDGEVGIAALDRLLEQHGPIPKTVTATTGGGGRHFLFAYAVGVGSRVRFADGLDTLGDGGYIVAAPSRHASGQMYEWQPGRKPNEIPVAAAPEWLLDLVGSPASTPASAPGNDAREPIDAALDPRTLVDGATRCSTRDAEDSVVAALLLEPALCAEIAEGLSPGDFYFQEPREVYRAIATLHRRRATIDLVTVIAELDRTGRSAMAGGRTYLVSALETLPNVAGAADYARLVREAARVRAIVRLGRDLQRDAEAGTDTDAVLKKAKEQLCAIEIGATRPRAAVVQMSTVTRQAIEWLWAYRIPIGEITLLEGDPGKGKSSVTLQLAAAVSKGTRLGMDGDPLSPGSVLLLSAEDDLARTVRPRLEEAGADLTCIHAITGISAPGIDGEERELTLDNTDLLAAVVDQYSPRLIILDPVQAYLGAAVDAHRANEVRPRLRALRKIAGEYGCAIVIVRHLSKGTSGGRLLHRGLGSVDFAAAARSILHVARHPEDVDDVGRRVLVHVKCNLAAHQPTLAFSLTPAGFRWEGVVDIKESAVQIDESRPPRRPRGRPDSERRAGEAWLRSALEAGPRVGRELLADAEAAGHSERTIQRAASALRVLRSHARPGKPSMWALPLPPSQGDQFWQANSGTHEQVHDFQQKTTDSSMPEIPAPEIQLSDDADSGTPTTAVSGSPETDPDDPDGTVEVVL